MIEPTDVREASMDVQEAGIVGERTFESFFAETNAKLYSALCLMTRNRHEAEEIAQDAYLAVWERWDRVANMDSPTGYLYRTAMNVMRRRRRRAMLAIKRVVHLEPQHDDLSQIEEEEAIVRALAPLTQDQRAAIVLLDLLDYSSEEAARMLGMKPGTVRTLASRGRAEIRRQVGEQDG